MSPRTIPDSGRFPDPKRAALLRTLFGPQVPAEMSGSLLRTADIATLFQVSVRTVSEWARRGRIPSVRTPGGQRRYPREQILAIFEESDGRPPIATSA